VVEITAAEIEICDLQEEVALNSELLSQLEELYAIILRDELGSGGTSGPFVVSLVFVDRPTIRSLNAQFLGRQKPTDVLSFPMEEDRFLGEVVISPTEALVQAREYGHSLQREISFLAVHGLLHLLGYGHDSPQDRARMRQREEEVLEAYGLGR